MKPLRTGRVFLAISHRAGVILTDPVAHGVSGTAGSSGISQRIIIWKCIQRYRCDNCHEGGYNGFHRAEGSFMATLGRCHTLSRGFSLHITLHFGALWWTFGDLVAQALPTQLSRRVTRSASSPLPSKGRGTGGGVASEA